MAKTTKQGRVLQSYTIEGTTNVVKVGDCVLMLPSESNKLPYVARVLELRVDRRNKVWVMVQWYYRPEDSKGGRKLFHGVKELFLSDHYDWQSAHTIDGMCIVHTFRNYNNLKNVGDEDYFCRFEYETSTGIFSPDRVSVYCKCEMPYNPDDLMVQCEGCKDWFHPSCVEMSIEDAQKLERYICPDCSSEDDDATSKAINNNSFAPSPSVDAKAEPKRRKR